MKTYRNFDEAVSAARLAQLAAKGKGDAAAAKMKADNLTGVIPPRQQKALPAGGGAMVRTGKQNVNSGSAYNTNPSEVKKSGRSVTDNMQGQQGSRPGTSRNQKMKDAAGSFINRQKRKASDVKKGMTAAHRNYRKTRAISQKIFNKPGTTDSRGDSSANTGASTQVDRG